MSIQVAIAPGDRVVPWINQCSPEWPLKPLKYAAKINARTLGENIASDYEINYIDISSVDTNGQQDPAETMTFGDAPSRARRIVASGDVIISTVRTYLKAISYIENANDNLICSTGFAVITASPQVYPKFLFYWVRCEWFVNEIVARSVGVSYPAINAIEIGNLPFPAIPVEEQQAIADYLDRETSRIDELIARNQRLIDLLQEQRTALITHTVTKGLNPDAPMKDSGVEWLGEIPAHWDIKKLKYISSVKFSSVDKHSKEDEQSVYLCNYTDVYNNDTILPTQEFMEATATKNEIALFSLKEQDVIVTKDSEDWTDIAVPGYVAVNLPNVICGYHLVLIRPHAIVITGKYLFWSFCARNLNHQFTRAATGITRFGLGKYWLDTSLFLIPPVQEQKAIADYLDRETSRIDTLVDRISQAIEKLEEHRSALITAAVTGKIDVRQHVS